MIRFTPALACTLCAAALVYGVKDMPRVGDGSAPANIHPQVAVRYLDSADKADGTLGEVGPANVVTSVLGDYRGYDTLGETTVIFTAALCVVLLLRYGHGTGGSPWPGEGAPSQGPPLIGPPGRPVPPKGDEAEGGAHD